MKKEYIFAADCLGCGAEVLFMQRNKVIGQDAWTCEKCGHVNPWEGAKNRRMKSNK